MKIRDISAVIIIVIFLAGCASTPHVRPSGTGFESRVLTLGGVDYALVGDLETKYRFSRDWDSFARTLSLSSGGKKVIFCVGTKVALVDGEIRYMSHPAKMHKGSVAIPALFESSVISSLFVPISRKYPIQDKPIYRGEHGT